MLVNSARARSDEYWFEEERRMRTERVCCSVCVFSQLPIVAIMGKEKGIEEKEAREGQREKREKEKDRRKKTKLISFFFAYMLTPSFLRRYVRTVCVCV